MWPLSPLPDRHVAHAKAGLSLSLSRLPVRAVCAADPTGRTQVGLGQGVDVKAEPHSVCFPPNRVKMTAAPYNYSYIFKYIIIGE